MNCRLQWKNIKREFFSTVTDIAQRVSSSDQSWMERFHAVFPELSPRKVGKWDRRCFAEQAILAPQLSSLKNELQCRLDSLSEHRRQQEIEEELAELHLDMVVSIKCKGLGLLFCLSASTAGLWWNPAMPLYTLSTSACRPRIMQTDTFYPLMVRRLSPDLSATDTGPGLFSVLSFTLLAEPKAAMGKLAASS